MSVVQFQVRKDRLATTRVVDAADTPLADGQVRVRVLHFALTANNVTYAAFGDTLDYWRFFPVAPDADGSAWGCIPAWGFADVVASLHPAVAAGERLYGFWPMASSTVLRPARLSVAGFVDATPHRASLHAVYNQVQRCAGDPFYTPDSEALQALLRPLFTTAWLIDDFVADQSYFGTATPQRRGVVLLSSASSKTAWATAFLLARLDPVEVVGLTSAANVAFCSSLGVYHRVLGYDALDTLDADSPCVYLDFAGDAKLRRAVHGRFARLAYSCSIGGTHVAELGGAGDLPGPRPKLFFAPAQVSKRSAECGPAGLQQRLVGAWHAFRRQVAESSPPWLVVQWHRGADAVTQAYAQVLAGRGDPRLGHMLSLGAPPRH